MRTSDEHEGAGADPLGGVEGELLDANLVLQLVLHLTEELGCEHLVAGPWHESMRA